MVIISLISHFQINRRKSCYLLKKLEMFMGKMIQKLSVFDANEIFDSDSKNAYFSKFLDVAAGPKGQHI